MRLRAAALWWIAITAVAGIAGQWLGYPLEHLWRWLLALFIVALLIEYLTAQSAALTMALSGSKVTYLGCEATWQLQICNVGRRSVRVRCQPMSPPQFNGPVPELLLNLAPGQTEQLAFQQRPLHLGEHRWPQQPVELGGLLHLASWIRWLPLQTEVGQGAALTLVEPARLATAARRGTLDRQGPRTTPRRANAGQEFRSHRSYQPGDAPASIDWKSTARSGQLRVRETEAEQQLLIYFALDCGRSSDLLIDDMTALNYTANLIARLAEFANDAGDRFGILTFADQPLARLRPARGLSHLRAVRSVLTQVASVDAQSNPLSATLALAELLPQRALVLLFTNLDDVDAAGQLAQATLLLRPQHLPMLVSLDDPWVAEMAQAPGADLQSVYRGIAAREQHRAATQTRAQVERLGAVVVAAVPDKIESLVFARLRRLRAQHSV